MIDEPKIVNGKTVSKPLPNLHVAHYLAMLDKLIPLIAVVLAVGLIVAIVCYLVAHAAFKVLNWQRLSKRKLTFLELTPPVNTIRSTQASAKLVAVLMGISPSLTHCWIS